MDGTQSVLLIFLLVGTAGHRRLWPADWVFFCKNNNYRQKPSLVGSAKRTIASRMRCFLLFFCGGGGGGGGDSLQG